MIKLFATRYEKTVSVGAIVASAEDLNADTNAVDGDSYCANGPLSSQLLSDADKKAALERAVQRHREEHGEKIRSAIRSRGLREVEEALERHPREVLYLRDKEVFTIACGSMHTAVVGGRGILYTAGLEGNGRLGRALTEDEKAHSCGFGPVSLPPEPWKSRSAAATQPPHVPWAGMTWLQSKRSQTTKEVPDIWN